MQALTEFDATREQIIYALELFRSGFAERTARAESKRLDWIEQRMSKDWFRRKFAYWNDRSLGIGGDAFENYAMKYTFREKIENFYWFENKVEKAEALLKRFDCAVTTLNAVEIIMSDEDLGLLSIAVESALTAK